MNTVLTAISVTVVGVMPIALLGAAAVYLRSEFGFDQAQLGLLVSVFFLASGAGSAPLGKLTDRLGGRRAAVVGALGSVCSLLGAAHLASTWLHLAVFVGLGGASNALTQGAGNRLVSQVRPARRGISFGAKQAAVPVGYFFAGVSVSSVAPAFGWRPLYTGAAVLAAAFAAALPQSSRRQVPAASPLVARGVSGNPWLLAFAAGLCGAAGNTAAAFVVDAGVSVDVPERMAAAALAAGSGLAIATRIGAGALADRSSGEGYRALVSLLSLGCLGFLLLASTDSPHPIFYGIVAAFTLATGWGWTGLVYYIVVNRYPMRPGAATGIALSGVYLGTIVGPPAFGHIAATAGYDRAWAAAGTLMAAGLSLVLLDARRAGQDRARPDGQPLARRT